MMKKILIVALAALLCAGVVYAQGGQRGMFGPGQRMDAAHADLLKTYLNLDDQQLQSLKDTQGALRTAVEPTMQKIGEQAKALRDAYRATPVDAALAAKLKAEIDDLRKQADGVRSQYRLQAQDVLTADQKNKLAALQRAITLMPAAGQAGALNLLDMPQGGFPGGRGGPGMGGGHRGPDGPGPESRIRP